MVILSWNKARMLALDVTGQVLSARPDWLPNGEDINDKETMRVGSSS